MPAHCVCAWLASASHMPEIVLVWGLWAEPRIVAVWLTAGVACQRRAQSYTVNFPLAFFTMLGSEVARKEDRKDELKALGACCRRVCSAWTALSGA